ncbi:hypothetical protein BDM02DRAFT_3117959 [Thelephora ganbajun]|uniref:Uncharacterized protein n=1 Tax=Thelephora ganbajun TaxID=370292 RepID=A0ACB6ZB99_THEGA|nr:hypothetical protein BDM02DRAFT_3117959 [Thelephora ganbajun]
MHQRFSASLLRRNPCVPASPTRAPSSISLLQIRNRFRERPPEDGPGGAQFAQMASPHMKGERHWGSVGLSDIEGSRLWLWHFRRFDVYRWR